jgi:hypothetical protein
LRDRGESRTFVYRAEFARLVELVVEHHGLAATPEESSAPDAWSEEALVLRISRRRQCPDREPAHAFSTFSDFRERA